MKYRMINAAMAIKVTRICLIGISTLMQRILRKVS